MCRVGQANYCPGGTSVADKTDLFHISENSQFVQFVQTHQELMRPCPTLL